MERKILQAKTPVPFHFDMEEQKSPPLLTMHKRYSTPITGISLVDGADSNENLVRRYTIFCSGYGTNSVKLHRANTQISNSLNPRIQFIRGMQNPLTNASQKLIKTRTINGEIQRDLYADKKSLLRPLLGGASKFQHLDSISCYVNTRPIPKFCTVAHSEPV
ncbi:hypothetical protein Ciccas_014537 [Cichlidogyrus casuarinus]|uniref:Uncharacterized protein n=1 Tax=Cichlidogyrus casuarinus TaxID=1844966 RepID=A0ABD2PIM6_9PLAT